MCKKSDNSEQQSSSSPWTKVLKLFLEFVVAAVTAFLTAQSGNAMGLW